MKYVKRAPKTDDPATAVQYYMALADLGCKINGDPATIGTRLYGKGHSLTLADVALHPTAIVDRSVGEEVNHDTIPDTHELLIIPKVDLDGRPYTRSEAVLVAACLGRHCNERRAGPLRANVCGPILTALGGGSPPFKDLVAWIGKALGTTVHLWVDRRATPFTHANGNTVVNVQYNTFDKEAMAFVASEPEDRYAFDQSVHSNKTKEVRLVWSTFGGLSAKLQSRGSKAVHGREITHPTKNDADHKCTGTAWYADPCVRMGPTSKTKMKKNDPKIPFSLACLCDARLCSDVLYSWYWCKGDDLLVVTNNPNNLTAIELRAAPTVTLNLTSSTCTWPADSDLSSELSTMLKEPTSSKMVLETYTNHHAQLRNQITADLVHRKQGDASWFHYIILKQASWYEDAKAWDAPIRQKVRELIQLVMYGADGEYRPASWFDTQYQSTVKAIQTAHPKLTRHQWDDPSDAAFTRNNTKCPTGLRVAIGDMAPFLTLYKDSEDIPLDGKIATEWEKYFDIKQTKLNNYEWLLNTYGFGLIIATP